MVAVEHLVSIFAGAVQVIHVVQEDLDGLHLEAELAIDLKGFLEHLITHSNFAHSRPIKVVQSVDVVLHTCLVGLRIPFIDKLMCARQCKT